MILLLGGTTEAKQVAAFLDEAALHYIYSTRTEVPFSGKGDYRFGVLNKKEMERLCREQEVSLIIDACHPFAAELHQTVASLNIPAIRFLRPVSERVNHHLVHYVDDYDEALHLFQQRGFKSLLSFSGVQSIPKLQSFWKQNIAWFRILDRDYSRGIAMQYHFPEDRLLYGLPQEKEEEVALFRRLNPEVILTKESGVNGKLDDKIAAAMECAIPIVVLKIPALPKALPIVRTLEELKEWLKHV